MDFLQALNRIMATQNKIALATSVDNAPNVRIVNFYYDPQNKGVLYFFSAKGDAKMAEFSMNKFVAFTTVPHTGNEHVRATQAIVKKSMLTADDLKGAFIKKIPGFDITIEQVGDQLTLYEVHFEHTYVTIDFTQSASVTLCQASHSLS